MSLWEIAYLLQRGKNHSARLWSDGGRAQAPTPGNQSAKFRQPGMNFGLVILPAGEKDSGGGRKEVGMKNPIEKRPPARI
jgi:hypothetical protein